MSDFTLKEGNFEALPEKGSDNFATGIYEVGYDGLLIARCNQNGRYPEHARAILAGLNSERNKAELMAKIIGWRNSHGNPNGTLYEQGQWDMAQRILHHLLPPHTPAPAPRAMGTDTTPQEER